MIHQVASRRRTGLRYRTDKPNLLAWPRIKWNRIITHNNRHARCLDNSRNNNQQTKNSPSILSQPLSAGKYNQVRDDAHSLQNDCKGHEEPDGPPHRTEISVFAMAVFAGGEAFAGICQGGAAAVETVGVVVGGL